MIGPNVSISAGTVIERSTLRDTIVGGGSRIVESRLRDSLLGDEVVVQGVTGAVSVGDHSEVQAGGAG